MKLNVGLIQLRISDGSFKENIDKGITYIERLASQGSDIIVLPELWPTGYGKNHIIKFVNNQELVNELVNNLISITLRYDTLIIAPIPYKVNNLIFNSAIAISKGKVIGRYDKIHLFSLYNEDKIFSKGKSITIVKVKEVSVGIAICYDLRFPELFRLLTLNGAEVIAVPASWGAPRGEQWRVLLRARAMENQVIVLGVNRVGSSSVINEEFAGYSCVIDPLGNEVACLGRHEEAINVSIETNWIREARTYIPLWRDRRRDLYSIESVWGKY